MQKQLQLLQSVEASMTSDSSHHRSQPKQASCVQVLQSWLMAMLPLLQSFQQAEHSLWRPPRLGLLTLSLNCPQLATGNLQHLGESSRSWPEECTVRTPGLLPWHDLHRPCPVEQPSSSRGASTFISRAPPARRPALPACAAACRDRCPPAGQTPGGAAWRPAPGWPPGAGGSGS